MRDLRTAVRIFRQRPGFSAAVVATLGIALGTSSVIFTLVHALVFRPLPFPQADQLVEVSALLGNNLGRLTLLEYRDLARDTRTFEAWGSYYRSQYNVTGGGPPEALTCTIASSTLFRTLGIRPVYGDVWAEAQDFTRQYLVLLSHRVWRQRFGGRPDVVGSAITLDGASYTVTGVLPNGFDYPLRTDVVRAATDYNAPHLRRYSAVARIRAGSTLADAQAELDAISSRFAQAYPLTNTGVRLVATPLRDAYVGHARPFLWLLVVAVSLLLVIACVNVTNLLISRAVASSGESAVRLALGAERRHLIRQFVAEAVVLAGMGSLSGTVAGFWGLRALMSMVRADLPPWFAVRFDASALAFAAALGVVAAGTVGVVTALQASRVNIERVLRQTAGRTAGGRHQRARRILLGGQAAFATILLVAAGLFAGGLRALLRADPGFDASHLLTFRVDPPFVRYPDIQTTSEFYRRAAERLGALAGVVAAGANTSLPFSGRDNTSTRIVVEGQMSGRADEQPFVNVQLVDPGYFDAMRIPIVRGRVFLRTDLEGSTPVAIVSTRTARRLWGDADPIGRRVRIVWNQSGIAFGGGSDVWLTVVGLVGNVRFSGVHDDTGLDVYAPDMQLFAGDSYLVVRTAMDADAIRGQIRAALDGVDPDQSFFDVEAMTERVRGSVWHHRVASAVLTMFAAIALCLAVIGTYAVTAHAVASERREIGIRLALGSPDGDVVWLVLRRWLVPVACGVAVGLLAGGGIARVIARMIGTTRMPGLVAPASLPLLLAAAAALACYLPVWRTLRRVRLTEVLRAE
ncbi:MAG TPA: ADOP family duplicated permease [Vicinamibacterales bacterium]|jgi:putative ABC transport system permease protein